MKRIFSLIIPIAVAFAAASCQKATVEPLKADFLADKTQITMGESVTFSDISDGTPAKWEWHFEGADVETAVTSSPVVTYSKAGTFGVTLKVTRNGVTDTKECPGLIKVNYPGTIVADFEADNTTLTDVDEVRLKDLSTGSPNTWAWTLTDKAGNTITSAEQNPKFTLPAGVYSVKLEASSPVASDSKTKADYITVIDKYTVSAAFTANTRMTYAGGSITFKDVTIGEPTGWEWTFEGGSPATSTEQNPTVSYAVAGTYKVTFKAKNSYKSDETTVEKFVQVISADQLVAYYPFNGDTQDYGPNGIHLGKFDVGEGGGTIDTNSDSHDGICGSSVYFDSESSKKMSYLKSEDSAIAAKFDPTKDYSYSFWAKVSSDLKSNVTFFFQGRGSRVTLDGKNGQNMSRFQYNPGAAEKNFSFVTRQQVGANAVVWCQWSGKVTGDEWHHFVCVSKVVGEKRVDNIYIDGEKKTSDPSANNHRVDAFPFAIGTSYAFVAGTADWEIQDRYLGNIDEFLVYNRALSEEEISVLCTY